MFFVARFLDVKVKYDLVFLVLRVTLHTTHTCTIATQNPRWQVDEPQGFQGSAESGCEVRQGLAQGRPERAAEWVLQAVTEQPSKERRGPPAPPVAGSCGVTPGSCPLSLCTLGVLFLLLGLSALTGSSTAHCPHGRSPYGKKPHCSSSCGLS